MRSEDLFSSTLSPLHEIKYPLFKEKQITVYLKRDDLIHPEVSGNKWRKLKYNFIEAEEMGHQRIVTFGGAFSNHIYATAAAAKMVNFKSVGVIRGEPWYASNPTLQFATSRGMQLDFVDRETYRLRHDADFLKQLSEKYPNSRIIPEGGTNQLAIKGVMEIANEFPLSTTHVCVAAGTGGTLAGIANGGKGNYRTMAFPVLKGAGLKKEMFALIEESIQPSVAWIDDYHFGGYAKLSKELIHFMYWFKDHFSIGIEPIYTAKMLYGLFDLIREDYFAPGSEIIAVHTGGMQGLKGLEQKISKKYKIK